MNRLNESAADRYRPLITLTLTRLREFTRRPEAVFWVYFFPILMVLALGIAFRNRPIDDIRVDVQQGPRAEQIVEVLQGDPRIRAEVHGATECFHRLRTGRTALYIVADQYRARGEDDPPAATDSSGTAEEFGRLAYHLDPTRPGSLVAKDAVDTLLQQHAGRRNPIATTVVENTEPGGRYIDFLIPGLLGMGLMGGGLWGVGYAIVDMRIRKLLKRFQATPMRRSDFLLGIMFSRLLFMVPEMILLVLVAWLLFGVVIYGSFGAVVFLILLGAVQFSGIGLLIASRVSSMEAVAGLMNLTMLPMWTFSGVFFSYENFPEVIHPAIRLLPLTPLIDSLRAVMLEGATLASLGFELSLIVFWTIATFALALAIFRWRD